MPEHMERHLKAQPLAGRAQAAANEVFEERFVAVDEQVVGQMRIPGHAPSDNPEPPQPCVSSGIQSGPSTPSPPG